MAWTVRPKGSRWNAREGTMLSSHSRCTLWKCISWNHEVDRHASSPLRVASLTWIVATIETMIFNHPLDGARGKVTRAMQHAVSLREHCSRYSSSVGTSLSVKHDAASNTVEVRLDRVEDPPPYLSAILGDIAHNLRSALDQVIWQLALMGPNAEALDDERVARTIQFPIKSSKEQFRSLSMLKHFDAETKLRLESWQPFNNLEGGTHLVNPLAILQAISNTDKHRLLIPAVGKINLDDIQIYSTIPLYMDQAEILVEQAAFTGSGTPLVRIPCGNTSGTVDARLEKFPLPEFWIESIGMLRTDQAVSLVGEISDVVEDLGRDFPPPGNFETRTKAWVTPDL